MTQTERYSVLNGAAMLVAPGYEAQMSESWFEPESWGANATAVQEGGRGSAWFVGDPDQRFVLRRYQRGGLAARLSKDRYLFTRESAVRSFAEFRIVRRLQALGLPVPEVVGAYYELAGMRQYRAAILLERLSGANTFPASEQTRNPALWDQVGNLIRRFHDAGLDHADLNCDNILVTSSALYLIDFDRCRLRLGKNDRGDWRNGNMRRLRRSVDKLFSQLNLSQRQALWEQLLAGYEASDRRDTRQQ
jgi:3-deoxy-D-manno-octulosonic acid kinase